ncbi:MAG: CBS domain-containing protein, partial [Candidatus Aenigmatarchaeota archaeon]
SGHRRLPVVNKSNSLVGIITLRDFLDAYLRRQDVKEKVSSIMTRDVQYVDADDSIGLLLQKFKISRRGGFPVTHKNRLVGMVSERDIVKHFESISFGISVSDIMTKKPFFVHSHISILDCLKTMVNTNYRRLPLVTDRKLVGIVTAMDILKYIKENDYNFVSLTKPLKDIIIDDVLSADKNQDISDAISIMKKKNIGGLPVVDEKGVLDGFITERDIVEIII